MPKIDAIFEVPGGATGKISASILDRRGGRGGNGVTGLETLRSKHALHPAGGGGKNNEEIDAEKIMKFHEKSMRT